MSSNVFTILNAVHALLGGAAPQPDTPSHAMLLAAAGPGTAVLHRGYKVIVCFSSYLVVTAAFTYYTQILRKTFSDINIGDG